MANKIVMTHDQDGATILNNKVRNAALHVFISGLKKYLKSIVFPAQPKVLPARKAEASIGRCIFANLYAKAMEKRNHASDPKNRWMSIHRYLNSSSLQYNISHGEALKPQKMSNTSERISDQTGQ